MLGICWHNQGIQHNKFCNMHCLISKSKHNNFCNSIHWHIYTYQRVQMFQQVDWRNNQKLNAGLSVNDKCELVFEITEIHASSQRFGLMTNRKNDFCKTVLGFFKIALLWRDWHLFICSLLEFKWFLRSTLTVIF